MIPPRFPPVASPIKAQTITTAATTMTTTTATTAAAAAATTTPTTAATPTTATTTATTQGNKPISIQTALPWTVDYTPETVTREPSPRESSFAVSRAMTMVTSRVMIAAKKTKRLLLCLRKAAATATSATKTGAVAGAEAEAQATALTPLAAATWTSSMTCLKTTSLKGKKTTRRSAENAVATRPLPESVSTWKRMKPGSLRPVSSLLPLSTKPRDAGPAFATS
mmetsp:Transcript_21798/g.60541  ORF Transcript_21798/g.60541 Transcript_21798/m.60541 type:complete len:224 (+) Transcript_21798:347-1018(+)